MKDGNYQHQKQPIPRIEHNTWGGAAAGEAETESGAGRKSGPTGRT